MFEACTSKFRRVLDTRDAAWRRDGCGRGRPSRWRGFSALFLACGALGGVAPAAAQSPPANTAPEFGATVVARSFPESYGVEPVQDQRYVGLPVAASDADGDSLEYSLEGVDADRFTVNASSGQVSNIVGELYDFEEKQSYSVVVTVVDGNGGTDSVQVDISVLNEPEWPSVLDAPTVLPVPGTGNSLEATWQAPDSRGKPPIESYEILVQQPHPPDSFATAAGTSSILTDLAPLTTYAVRVRAINADGLSSDFSRRGHARTNGTEVCDRTPQVRDDILEALRTDQCEGIEATDLATIRVMRLDGTGLTELAPSDFEYLSSVTRLELFGNSLSSLPSGVFRDMEGLRELNLYDSGISSLSPDSFSGLAALVRLRLDDNRLTALPASVFSDLSALERLDLSGNLLRFVPSGVFSPLSALVSLDLSDNTLSGLPASPFSRLASLTDLQLDRNSLFSLPATVFSGLSALESLSLSENFISSLPPRLIAGLDELKRLNLNDNLLSRLPGAMFEDPGRLDRVFLGHNSLPNLLLPLWFERRGDGSVPGEVSLVVRTDTPMPGAGVVSLEIHGGRGPKTATIRAGKTESNEFTVTREGDNPLRVLMRGPILREGTCSSAAECFRGFGYENGTPFTAFEQVKLVLTPASIAESGGMSTVTATVSPPSPTPFTVEVSSFDDPPPRVGAASALSTHTTLSFAANATRSTGRVVIAAIDNSEPAAPSIVNVDGRDETSVGVQGVVSDASVTRPLERGLPIVDDEAPFVTASFGSSRYCVREGGAARVEVRLSEDPKRQVSIPLVVRNRGGVSADDYAAPIPEELTFAPGETRAGFEFEAVPDDEPDGVEGVVVYLTPDRSQRLRGEGSAAVMIAQPGGGCGGSGGGGGSGPPPSDGSDEEDDGDGGDGDGDGDGGGGGNDGGQGLPPRAAIGHDAECVDGLCRARTGVPVTFEDASSGDVRFRTWDFGDGITYQRRTVAQNWSAPGFYEVTLQVSNGTVESALSLKFLVEAGAPAGTCEPGPGTRCLGDSRYAVEVEWWTADGRSGAGTVVHEGTNDSGLFWFFNRDNWEALVKVLDGCTVNGHVWVFGASTTDLGYRVAVTDTVTGTVREYNNEAGTPAGAITDVTAFPEGCRR